MMQSHANRFSDTATVGALLEATTAISADGQSIETLEAILSHAAAVVGAEASSLIMFDRFRKKLVFKATCGQQSSRLVGESFDAKLGIAGYVARTGQVAVANNVTDNRHFYDGFDDKIRFETRRLICAPLRCRGQIMGVVQAINKKDGTSFSPADLDLLQIFSNLAAVPSLHPDLTESTFKFALDAEIWDIRFADGQRVEAGRFPRSAALGLAYFYQLMSRPFADVTATDLIQAVNPADRGRAAGGHDAGSSSDQSSYQASIDTEALRDIYRRIEELKADIDKAHNRGDWTTAEMLNHELEQLREQLKRDTSFMNRIKTVSDKSPQRRARESIRLALARARSQLAKSMPLLANHLAECVRVSGYSFAYHHPPHIQWEL